MIESPVPKTAGLAGLADLLNLLLEKAESLADVGEILVLTCETVKTRQICLCCYGDSISSIFVATHQTRPRVFNWKPRFRQNESEAMILNIIDLKPAVFKNFAFD